MRSLLDDAAYWFFDELAFCEHLTVTLTRGEAGSVVQDLVLSKHTAIRGVRSIEPTRTRAHVRFASPVAYQVIDESYTAKMDEEAFESSGTISVLTKSRYLDYVHECHGWFRDVAGPAKHYRLCTLDVVIDVIGPSPPSLEILS